MRRSDLVRDKLARDVEISAGFGENVSLQHGLVMGQEGGDQAAHQGAMGTVVPVAGCKHIKVVLGSE